MEVFRRNRGIVFSSLIPAAAGGNTKKSNVGEDQAYNLFPISRLLPSSSFPPPPAPLPRVQGRGIFRRDVEIPTQRFAEGFEFDQKRAKNGKNAVYCTHKVVNKLHNSKLAPVISQLYPKKFGGQGKQEGKKGFLAVCVPLLGLNLAQIWGC